MDTLPEPTDVDATVLWRWEQALELGANPDDAERFAMSDGDLNTLRTLVEKRACDPHVAVEILA